MQPSRLRKRALKKRLKKERQKRIRTERCGEYSEGGNLKQHTGGEQKQNSAIENQGNHMEKNNEIQVPWISDDHLKIAESVLRKLASDDSSRFKSRRFKNLRSVMGPLLLQMASVDQQKALKAKGRRNRGGSSILDINAITDSNDTFNQREAQRRRELDAKWRDSTLLRRKRLEKLRELEKQDPSPPRIQTLESKSRTMQLDLIKAATAAAADDDGNDDAADTKIMRVADGVADADRIEIEETKKEHEQTPRVLNSAVLCYTCKRPYTRLHFFYDSLCPKCAELNFTKRHQSADLSGKICLVTGARVKIGFRCTLILLRAGATVIATTRFPKDAARRYAAQDDASKWTDRLHIYGLDFRDSIMVEAFCSYIIQTHQRMDVIINNACQTIRRPRMYYRHLLKIEAAIPTAKEQPFLLQSSILESKLTKGHKQHILLHGAGASSRSGSNNSSSKRRRINKTLPQTLTLPSSGSTNTATTMPTQRQRKATTSSSSLQDDVIFQEGGGKEGSTIPLSSLVTTADDDNHGNNSSIQQQQKEQRQQEEDHHHHHHHNDTLISTTTRPNVTADGVVCSSPTTTTTTTTSTPHNREEKLGDTDVVVVANSVRMSQMVSTSEDHAEGMKNLLPVGKLDVNEQQVDLRRKNSWMLRLDEVSTTELSEVFAINAMAPFIINARLKSLMAKDKTVFKFIVNVSAMEGKFYRYKSDKHPHTNMAKAALNMMTRTSAQDYMKEGIYMTAVDTGWINDEKPIEKAREHMEKHNFQTPLDEVDAAARVLDPVMAPLLDLQAGKENVKPLWGVFLKDYVKTEW